MCFDFSAYIEVIGELEAPIHCIGCKDVLNDSRQCIGLETALGNDFGCFGCFSVCAKIGDSVRN